MSDAKREEVRYWLLNGPIPTGPFSMDEIGKLPPDQATPEIKVCRVGEGVWRPLREVVGPSSDRNPFSSPDAVLQGKRPTPLEATVGNVVKNVFKGGGVLFFILLALSKVLRGCNSPNKADPAKAVVRNVAAQPQDPRFDNRPAQPPLNPANARISVSASDGTGTLQRLVAGLPQEQIAILNLRTVLTGADTYGVHVRIRNTGNVTVRIFPGNFRVHFGEQSTFVTTTDHAAFLRECVLAPGQSAEGLVMYEATIDAGAAIRLLGTSFAYDDPTLLVDYR
jgi:hypothetical protein